MKYKIYSQYGGRLALLWTGVKKSINEAKSVVHNYYMSKDHHDIIIVRANPYLDSIACILPKGNSNWIDLLNKDDVV